MPVSNEKIQSTRWSQYTANFLLETDTFENRHLIIYFLNIITSWFISSTNSKILVIPWIGYFATETENCKNSIGRIFYRFDVFMVFIHSKMSLWQHAKLILHLSFVWNIAELNLEFVALKCISFYGDLQSWWHYIELLDCMRGDICIFVQKQIFELT